jgi:hypothetical protein
MEGMTGAEYATLKAREFARQRQARKRARDLEQGRHTCPKCGKSFDRREYLERHIKINERT